jgi:16S rRNA (uracil1498-N3)-methyltransferase
MVSHGFFLVRRFLAPTIPAEGGLVRLGKDVSHHLLRVTGIAPGEVVELFDGSGLSCRAELVRVAEGVAMLKVTELLETQVLLRQIHLVLAQTRANTMDTVLRMVSELGVASIQVVQTHRCVAKGNKIDRWVRIVQSAAAQSGRSVVPLMHLPVAFSDLIARIEGTRLICAPGNSVGPPVSGNITLLVGPEGGFTAEEIDQAVARGWGLVGLGDTVLKADTAAVVAVAQYAF